MQQLRGSRHPGFDAVFNERDHLRPKGIKVVEADIGRAVVYRTAPNFEPEQGVITSFNDRCVFVRYGNSIRGVATNPDDLDWMVPA